MLTSCPRLQLGWLSPALAVLKALLLGALVLWYAALPVVLIEDATRNWPLHEAGGVQLLSAVSACVVAGGIASRLIRRVWIACVVLATAFLVCAGVSLAIQPNGVEWPEIALTVRGLAIVLGWSGAAAAIALMLKRWAVHRSSRRDGLQTALAGGAGVVTGLTVLLHPGLLDPLLVAFIGAWPSNTVVPDDAVLALYYSLSGLAAGFTSRLLGSSDSWLCKLQAFALAGLWCAFAARTLLDEDWLVDHPSSAALPLAPLLALTATAVFTGWWLAHWPYWWSRDA